MLLVAAMVVSISASAQFQEGKGYLGASLTGLDLHYNGQDGLNLGVQAKAGYFPWCWWTLLYHTERTLLGCGCEASPCQP